MLKLIKYDILKLKTWLLGYFIGLLASNGLFILSMKTDLPDIVAELSIMLFALFCVVSPVMLLVFTVMVFSTDINNKHGYMTFLTPKSTAAIVGSKVIVSFLLLIVVGAAMLTSIALTLSALTDGDVSLFSELAEVFEAALKENYWGFFLFIISSLVSYFRYILMIDLAIVISAAIFGNGGNGKAVARVVTAVLYVALAYVFTKVDNLLIDNFGNMMRQKLGSDGISIIYDYTSIGVVTVERLLMVFGMFILISWLLDRKVSL